MRVAVSAVGLVLSLAACATVVDPVQRNAPLKLAFTDPVDGLASRAETGDQAAQYAVSFLAKFGLRGVVADPVRVEALRARAGFPTTRSQPIYVPGGEGRPGTTIMTPITTPGIGDAEARRMDLCGLSLLASQPALGGQICGSPAAYADLLPAAIAVRQQGPTPAPDVDPASVVHCDGHDTLWASAINQFERRDHASASVTLDRIIALCGEAPPSWNPRVMRALIAIEDEQPDRALTLLAPIPRPAPGAVGPYAGFVAMQAQRALGDMAAYGRERDALLNASLAAVSAEPGTEAVGPPIDLTDGILHVRRRPVTLFAGLESELTILFMPKAADVAPATYYLNVRPDPLGGPERFYILDEYRCDGRAAIHYFDPGQPAPSVETVVDLIRRRRLGEVSPVSGSDWNLGLTACQFPRFVTPGLYDQPETMP